METTNKKEKGIGNLTAITMLGFASIVDFLQFVFGIFVITGILNYFISFIALITFLLWFALSGVSFTKSVKELRIGMTFFITVFGEIAPIPFLNVLPLWTVGTLSIIALTRMKEIV